MSLLRLDGTETCGTIVVAIRNLTHTLLHVGHATLLGRRIEAEVQELRQVARVMDGTSKADC